MIIKTRHASILCISLFLAFCPFLSSSAQSTLKSKGGISISGPKALIKTDSIPVRTTTRTFNSAKFHGLQKRYQSIDGIVMIGIMNKKQEVLLKGPDQWAPLGGAVEPGEDWAAAARRTALEQTGQQIVIRAPVLVERMRFQLQDRPETCFSAFILHLRATLSDHNWKFTKRHVSPLQWFSKVPPDAHPNHVQHIQLYLP